MSPSNTNEALSQFQRRSSAVRSNWKEAQAKVAARGYIPELPTPAAEREALLTQDRGGLGLTDSGRKENICYHSLGNSHYLPPLVGSYETIRRELCEKYFAEFGTTRERVSKYAMGVVEWMVEEELREFERDRAADRGDEGAAFEWIIARREGGVDGA